MENKFIKLLGMSAFSNGKMVLPYLKDIDAIALLITQLDISKATNTYEWILLQHIMPQLQQINEFIYMIENIGKYQSFMQEDNLILGLKYIYYIDIILINNTKNLAAILKNARDIKRILINKLNGPDAENTLSTEEVYDINRRAKEITKLYDRWKIYSTPTSRMFNEFFYYMTPNMKQQDVMPFHLFNDELRRRNAGEEIPHKWYEGGHF